MENQAAELLSIRNPEDLEKYPNLSDVREAMICAFDFIVEFHRYKYRIEDSSTLLLNEDEKKLAISLDLPAESDSLHDVFWLHLITKGKCDIASKVIFEFVRKYFSNKFDSWLLESNSKELKYFDYHYTTVLKHKETGLYYLVSPANIFNFYNDSENSKAIHNFTSPTFKEQSFDRTVGVLVASNYQSLLQALQSIEGDNTIWKDASDNEARFMYTMVQIEGKYLSIKSFVTRWQYNKYLE